MTIEVFIKKPEKVEVLQYDGTNYDEVVKFLGERTFNEITEIHINDHVVKYGNKITVSHDKPNFKEQELIGTYNKDVVQGVNPNVHMSLEKLQEYFEVPIVSEQKKDDDKITSNVDKITSNNCDVKKYRKKPIIVEAVQNTGKNVFEIGKFSEGKCRPVFTPNGYKFSVNTLEGTMEANVGDYIIKDDKGEFYPCKPDEFEASYDVCK